MLQVLRSCWTGRPEPFEGERDPRAARRRARAEAARSRAARRCWSGARARRRCGGRPCTPTGGSASRGSGGSTSTSSPAQLDAVRSRRSEEGLAPAVATLKLHAAPDVAEDIPAALESLAPLGLDEVIVEPPWTHGIDAAQATIRQACAVAR